jgi:SET domain-containing protein
MPSSKRKLLANLSKVYCRVQPSKLHGVGVFAIRRIPKGINPFEIPIPVEMATLTAADLRALPAGIRTMIRDYVVKQDEGYVLTTLGFNLLELELFVNHSNTPNLVFDEDEGCYRAARVIKPGEELTGNYDQFAPEMQHTERRTRRRSR